MGEFKLKLKGDKVIWLLVLFFALISILAVFSSSTYRANVAGVSKTTLFLEQIRFVLVGFAMMFFCYLVPLKWYRFLAFPIFGISVAALVMLFIPSCRVEINGAVRGIKVFGVTVQVFEFAKLGLILYLSRAMEIWQDDLNTFKDFALKLLLPVIAVCVMVMANSFSSAILFGLISFLMLFIMKVDLKYIGISLAGIVAVLIFLFGIYNLFYANKEYGPDDKKGAVATFFNRFGTVQSRFTDFFSEMKEGEKDIDELTPQERMKQIDEKRQSENAKIAIKQGGIIGKGPGKSTQRYSLSMAFSDFIYAFIIEEYGFVGGALIILLYVIFMFRCIRIGTKCNTIFSSSLVLGIAFLITIQAFLHILVNVRLIPITGHTLPLISHGGTAYLAFSMAFGMILSVSKQVDKQQEIAAATIQKEENTDEQTTDNN